MLLRPVRAQNFYNLNIWLAYINWQIVNETALQCVADKPSTVDGTTSEMVGLASRHILNSWLLQTRLRELRPDEDRSRSFFHYKLPSPFPVSDHAKQVSNLFSFTFICFSSVYVPHRCFILTIHCFCTLFRPAYEYAYARANVNSPFYIFFYLCTLQQTKLLRYFPPAFIYSRGGWCICTSNNMQRSLSVSYKQSIILYIHLYLFFLCL